MGALVVTVSRDEPVILVVKKLVIVVVQDARFVLILHKLLDRTAHTRNVGFALPSPGVGNGWRVLSGDEVGAGDRILDAPLQVAH